MEPIPGESPHLCPQSLGFSLWEAGAKVPGQASEAKLTYPCPVPEWVSMLVSLPLETQMLEPGPMGISSREATVSVLYSLRKEGSVREEKHMSSETNNRNSFMLKHSLEYLYTTCVCIPQRSVEEDPKKEEKKKLTDTHCISILVLRL